MSMNNIKRFFGSFTWLTGWVIAPIVLGALLIAGGVMLSRQEIDFDSFLNYFALGLLIFVVITIFYGIIAIHDIPYEIAKKRDHPHQDAIHAAGWVSLFTLHALWPFLWIWAMTYRPDRGWGFSDSNKEPSRKLDDMLRRIEQLEARTKNAGQTETKKKRVQSAPEVKPQESAKAEAD